VKGTRFEALLLCQQTLARELEAIQEEAFSGAFDSLYERCKCCAKAGGDHIELSGLAVILFSCYGCVHGPSK
jgi:hypothetical protein